MATRGIPPAHAPAHGLRRQLGNDGGAHPGRGPDGQGPPGLRKKEGAGGAQAQQAVDVTADPSLTSESRTREKNRKRRIEEKEIREQRKAQRQREGQKRRVIERSNNKAQSARAVQVADQGIQTEVSARSRGAVGQAVSGIDRAAALAAAGRGAEAALVLSAESSKARSAAQGMPPGDSDARILRGLATHMSERAGALRSSAPDHANKMAARLDRIAGPSESRANALAATGHMESAKVLAGLATDARGQASLLRAGAANAQTLMGQGLANAVGRIADASSKFMGIQQASLPPQQRASFANDNQQIGLALNQVGKTMKAERVGWHTATRAPADPKMLARLDAAVARGQISRPEAAAHFLRSHGLVGPLTEALDKLSMGLSRGDARMVDQARGDLVKALRGQGVLQAVQSAAQGTPAGALGAGQLVDHALPSMILDGIARGGLGQLASGGPGSIAGRMSSLPGLAPESASLRPSEHLITELARGAVGASAHALGDPESLVLGSVGFHAESGTLTQYLRAHALGDADAAAQFRAPVGAGRGLEALPPAGPHEQAVLMDRSGAVLVRGPEGVAFHQGQVGGPNGERYYMDANSPADGLRCVLLTPALQNLEPLTRVELDVSVDGADGVGDDETARKRKKKQREAAAANQKMSAVAIYRDGSSPSGFQGFTSRIAAKLSLREIERVNHGLPPDRHIEPIFVDVAFGIADRLASAGARQPEPAEYRDYVIAQIEGYGMDPENTAVLVLRMAPGDEHLIDEVVPGLSSMAEVAQPKETGAAFVKPGSGKIEPVSVPKDRNAPGLVDTGIVLIPGKVVID